MEQLILHGDSKLSIMASYRGRCSNHMAGLKARLRDWPWEADGRGWWVWSGEGLMVVGVGASSGGDVGLRGGGGGGEGIAAVAAVVTMLTSREHGPHL